jgi:hypothetical protein
MVSRGACFSVKGAAIAAPASNLTKPRRFMGYPSVQVYRGDDFASDATLSRLIVLCATHFAYGVSSVDFAAPFTCPLFGASRTHLGHSLPILASYNVCSTPKADIRF